LYLRASQWYAKQGDVAAAIDYAFKAQDNDRAAELMEEEARLHGLAPLSWLDALPEATLRAHPILDTLQVMLQIVSTQAWQPWFGERLDEIARRIEDGASTRLPTPYHRRTAGYLGWANGYIALLHGEYRKAADLVEETLHTLPPDAEMMRAMGLLLLGQVYIGLEDGERGNHAFSQAHELALGCGALLRAMIALTLRTIAMVRQGQLRAAAEILETGMERYAPGGLYAVPEVSGLAINLSAVWVHQKRLDEAEPLLLRALEWANLTAQSAIKQGAWFWLMHIRSMRGDWEGARAAWDEIASVMSHQPAYIQALAIELDAYRAAVFPDSAPELARRVVEYPLQWVLDDAAHGQLSSYGWPYAQYLALVRAMVASIACRDKRSIWRLCITTCAARSRSSWTAAGMETRSSCWSCRLGI
jgi:ATP/maltotriose-dependent transcriptional regulator MalT